MAEKNLNTSENLTPASADVGTVANSPTKLESQTIQSTPEIQIDNKPMETAPSTIQDSNATTIQTAEKKPYSPAIEPPSVEPSVMNDVQPMVAEESNSTHWV